MRTKEAAEYLGLTRGALYSRIAQIPHYRFERMLPFRREELDAWVEQHRVEPPRAPPCQAPNYERTISRSVYRQAVDAFRAKYPKVTRYSAWNEPNLGKTFAGSANAYKVGTLFNELWKECASPLTSGSVETAPKCAVIAGDFSERNLNKTYLDEYKRGTGLKGKSHAWATHPYTTTDTKTRSDRFALFLKATKGPVWLVESGAYYQKYKAVAPNGPFDNSPERIGRNYSIFPSTPYQYDRLRWTLHYLIPWKYNGQPSRVTHFYYYQWADNDEGFGSGLVRYAATASRPSLLDHGQPYCLYYYRLRTSADRETLCNV